MLKTRLLHAHGASRISRLAGCAQDLELFWSVSASLVCRSDSNPTKCQKPAWYFGDYSVGGGVLFSLCTVTEVLRNTFCQAERQPGSNWYLCHPTNEEEGEAKGHNQTWAVPDMKTIPCAPGLVPRRKAAGNEFCEELQ